MTIPAFIERLSDVALCAAQKWWRPITCFAVTGTVIVNGLWLPVVQGEGVDLTGLSLLVASLAPFVAARTWEKMKEAKE